MASPFIHQQLTEIELIQAIKTRSAEGLATLYDSYAILLYKIIWITVKDHELAERVLEETFLAICYEVREFPAQDLRFTLWMAGIAKRLALREIHKPLTEIADEGKPLFIPALNGIALH